MKTAILLLLLASCAPAPRTCPPCAVAAPMAVAAPAAIETCFTPCEDCEARIVARIAAARVNVRLQAYSFSSAPIAAALVAARGRGVDVRAVLDRTDEKLHGSKLTELAAAGIPVWVDSNEPIAHLKLLVIDERFVEFGSYNYSAQAKRNSEVAAFVDDTALAAKFLANWEVHRAHSERVGP